MLTVAVASVSMQSLVLCEIVEKCDRYSHDCDHIAVMATAKTLMLWLKSWLQTLFLNPC